jgi:hypothetical protein
MWSDCLEEEVQPLNSYAPHQLEAQIFLCNSQAQNTAGHPETLISGKNSTARETQDSVAHQVCCH